MTSQSGASGSPTGVAGGVLGGAYPSPTFATDGTTPILGAVVGALGADVPMGTANTYFDGPSVTLTAGTWLLIGHVTLVNGAVAASSLTAKLWDGTTNYDSAQQDTAINFVSSIYLSRRIVLAAGATLKISAAGTTNSTTMKAAAQNNPAGSTASALTALRIA